MVKFTGKNDKPYDELDDNGKEIRKLRFVLERLARSLEANV